MKYNPDKNTAKIRKWLDRSEGNIKALLTFMNTKGHIQHDIAHALSGHELKKFREEIVKKFKIK